MLLLFVAAAHADDAEARARLYDALLLEAARGDVTTAIARYQELANGLSPDSPLHAEAIYWLGHALYELDRVNEAREALVRAIRIGRCARCRALLEEIELEEQSITKVPTVWTFDGPHGLLHPFELQDRGSIRVAVGPGGHPALEWTTVAGPNGPDKLEAGVRTAHAEQIRFTIRSAALDAWIEVRVEDVVGRAFAALPVEVPRGATRRVAIPIDAFQPLDGGAPLDPKTVARIEIVDRTGLRTSGPNTLWLDEFELR